MSDANIIGRSQLNESSYNGNDEHAVVHTVQVLTECKIKLIFVGFDGFLNEHDAFDLKFDLSISEVDDSKWTGANPTELNEFPMTGWEKYESNGLELGNGHQIELGNQNKFRKSKYKFQFKTDNSLFGVTGIYIDSSEQILSIKYDFDDDSFVIDENYFQKKYFHKVNGDIKNEDKYLYIKVSIYLKLKLRFNLQGASEGYIYQGSDKKSLVLPIDTPSGYYDDDKKYESILDGDSILLKRDINNKLFKDFFNQDSIGFKAVNYRKDIYKGDENNVLSGDKYTFTTFHGIQVDFITNIEKEKYFHTEYIKNIIYIFIKNNKQNFLFETNEEIGKFTKVDFGIEKFEVYEEEIYGNNDDKNDDIQFIFLQLEFVNKKLKYKDIFIDKIKFSNDGKVV